jgi:glycosyltransferase involved in cell wall biosynthesis
MTGRRSIVIVANDSWYAVNFRSSLIAKLVQRGWSVVVLTPDREHSDALEALGARSEAVDFAPRSRAPGRVAGNVRALRFALRRLRPAAALTFNPMPNLAVSLAKTATGVPQVATVSGFGTMRARAAGAVLRATLRLPDAVLCQNAEDFAAVRKLRGPRRPTRRVAGSGVDASAYADTPRDYATLRVLYAGRFLRAKGVIDYVEAAEAVLREGLPDIRFALCGLPVAGEGGLSEAEMAARLEGTGIAFEGYVADMPARLAAADIVTLPSRYGEGIPRSLIEAAAAGCITVAYDNDGVREIVRDGETGILLREAGPDALVRAFGRLRAMSPERLAAMAEAGRRLAASKFSVEQVDAAYLEEVARLTHAGPSRRGA